MKNKNKSIKYWKPLFGVVILLVAFDLIFGDDEVEKANKATATTIEKSEAVKVLKVEDNSKKEVKPLSFKEKYINEDYKVIVDEFLKLSDKKRKEIDGRDMHGDKDDWIVHKIVRGNGIVVETDTMQYEDLVFNIYMGDKSFKNDKELRAFEGDYYEAEYLVTIRLKERNFTINEGDNVNFEGWLSSISDTYHYIDSSIITKR